MKSVTLTIFVIGVYFSVTAGENPNRFRRYDKEILKSRKNTFGEEVGIPLVFDGNTNTAIRAGIPTTEKIAKPEDEVSEKHATKQPLTLDEDKDVSGSGADDDDEDDSGSGSSAEEMGYGYDNIEGMEPSKEEKNSENDGSGSEGSAGDLDLSGEFPPNAEEIAKLPKDADLTVDEIDRKMADKRKGYFQFTIRQRFRPELKYKESSAYKILAGNVRQDVERALKARNVVTDVLFREAKDVGGPPYRSKVQVFLKVRNVSRKRLKKIVDYGLINGMITIPGSFQATFA